MGICSGEWWLGLWGWWDLWEGWFEHSSSSLASLCIDTSVLSFWLVFWDGEIRSYVACFML